MSLDHGHTQSNPRANCATKARQERASTKVHIFSSGTEFSCWMRRNCDHCVKEETCDLLHGGIGAAFLGDGKFDQETADRMGFTPERKAELGWPCAEFSNVKPEDKPAAHAMRDAGAMTLPGLEDRP